MMPIRAISSACIITPGIETTEKCGKFFDHCSTSVYYLQQILRPIDPVVGNPLGRRTASAEIAVVRDCNLHARGLPGLHVALVVAQINAPLRHHGDGLGG